MVEDLPGYTTIQHRRYVYLNTQIWRRFRWYGAKGNRRLSSDVHCLFFGCGSYLCHLHSSGCICSTRTGRFQRAENSIDGEYQECLGKFPLARSLELCWNPCHGPFSIIVCLSVWLCACNRSLSP
jgi:hypothetical protein